MQNSQMWNSCNGEGWDEKLGPHITWGPRQLPRSAQWMGCPLLILSQGFHIGRVAEEE